MAGETAIVYETAEQRAEPNGPVATAWLLGLWILAASAAAGGLTWTWLVPTRWLSSGVVITTAVMLGGPLFLLSWAYLADADGFRHRPFLVLAAAWFVTLTAPAVAVVARDHRFMPIILAVLPLISSVAMVRAVLRIRLGQQGAPARSSLPANHRFSPHVHG